MRLIAKGQEPIELTTWKKANPHGRYQELDNSEQGKSTRRAIRQAAIKEQFGLCAYCCKQIDKTNSNNEHLVSQRAAPNLTVDFANIVASCNTPRRCNQARGSKDLLLTPLMPECETELRYLLSGKVEGKTERASEAIEVLALDTLAIREERKVLVDSLIFGAGITPDDLLPPNEELLNILADDLKQPNYTGQLPAFSPALINIIRQLLVN
ncbi:retron system putative HNH endonuclease [Methylomonas fluvii]|uniref:TIGR02646 family protein n=1 Tax=Methylomonas fluvii TaxID=1854564 RepID=A0ABR9DB53_9GAMM|nr:retron system putative HNH endonuclease [Methylomonas fluvii]MBD9360283.1 TIGR02646 family protein [Methylomonas fluvii]CAD6873081.1 hypothetical protein [Methylomonas fluvii]